MVANLGLTFFLFLIGLELDPRVIIRNARRTLLIGTAGMLVPFAVSVGVMYALAPLRSDQAATYSLGIFYLFVGVALSITAFPVLARILSDLNLLRTPVGLLSVSAAAINDVVAWIFLALVSSLVSAKGGLEALWIFLVAMAYVVFAVFAIRPFYKLLLRRETRLSETGPSGFLVMMVFCLILASAFFTSMIGVHPIFGGFISGLVVPHDDGFAIKLAEKIEDFVSILFLPIYFALSGLKTQIGTLNDGQAWGYVILLTVVAFFGKAIGCALAAKVDRLPWRESITIGVLMSCKGLVELIVLNIGLDAHVLDDRMFSMFVMMAIITTAITTPVVVWLYPPSRQRELAIMKSAHPSTVSLVPTVLSRRSSVHEAVSETGPLHEQEHEQNMLIAVDQAKQVPTVYSCFKYFIMSLR